MAFDKGRALVIGVGSYSEIPQANIPISVTDARAVRSVLCNPDLCGYLPERVTLLHDGKASREAILGALAALTAETAPEDTVLLYYCGHGDYGTDGNYYLTTHDTRTSGGRVVRGTGIHEAELLGKLRTVPARRLLLLFNACHSGEISPVLGTEDQEKSFGDVNLPETAADALLSTGEGRIIITASRREQKSWIGSGELTLFAQALVDGLGGKGYVPNNNGYISAFALYEHMYSAIKKAADRLGKTQEPELTVLKGVGPFPVSLYRGATDLGAFNAEETPVQGTAVREIDPTRSARLFRVLIQTVTANGEGAVAVVGDGNVVGDDIDIGSIGSMVGSVVGRGTVQADIIVGRDQTTDLFDGIYRSIDKRPEDPDVDKEELIENVQRIQNETNKGEQANPNRISRWLRNLAAMAPDIFDVTVAALTSPTAGVAAVIRKVAQKAKADAQ
jgi:hypothetical protein